MSRTSRFLVVTIVVLFLLACNFVTQPLKDTQNLAETAQAIGSAIPAETLQALPSFVPSLEALETSMPNIGNVMDPQGTPAQTWREIPIMPQATAGQEFPENDIYSFKTGATAQEVQDFYNEKLPALGWNQPFNATGGGEVQILFYQKGNSSLTVTVMTSDGAVIVILTIV